MAVFLHQLAVLPRGIQSRRNAAGAEGPGEDRWRAARWWFGRLALFALANAGTAWAAPPPSEFDLKAVFLFHFTQFVEWPPAAFGSPNAPFVIGILGRDPFGAALEEVIHGEAVGPHRLIVVHVNDYQSARRCQILYLAPGSESRFATDWLRGQPVLTVGDTPEFAEEGGVIQFYADGNHVRVRVNLAAARADELLVSAKLLRVAEVINAD